MNIAATIIVKDEFPALQRAINSLKGHVDQLYVTFTWIDTPVIAFEVGDLKTNFGKFPWVEHFGKAKNAGLNRIVGADWVLQLDADEELVVPDGYALADLIERNVHADASTILVNVCSLKDDGSTVENEQQRLFKPELRYVGRVHEQIKMPDGTPPVTCRQVGAPVWVRHHGYLASERDQTIRRAQNLRLMEQAIREEPKDAGLMRFHLARHLTPDDPARALEYAREVVLSREWVNWPLIAPLVFATWANTAFLAESFDEVLQVWDTCPRSLVSAELCFVMASMHIKREEFEQADMYLHMCVSTAVRREIGNDPGVYGWKAMEALASLWAGLAKGDRNGLNKA